MKLPLLKPLLLLVIALVLGTRPLHAQAPPHNILLVLADDIGTDALPLYNPVTNGTSFAPTPNLDALATRGVRFRNCYGYPSCSPTRSCLLTGRYGFRTGIGAAIDDARTALDPYLSPREFTIPKALDAHPQLGFRHAQVGKWHLSGSPADPQAIGGWGHFSGFLGGERESYFDWEKVVDGVVQPHTTRYATSDNISDALRWMAAQGTNRWFLWLAPKAAHSPLHVPPAGLHSYRGLPDPPPANGAGSKLYYQAMIEALDTEMGRLLAQVNLANTLVVFLADNGTPTETIQPPFAPNQCKGTLFEGGIRLPLFMAGAGLVATNRWVDAVVHAVDLTATLLEMAGVDLAATLPPGRPFDGRSFAALLRNQPWAPAENNILSENFGSIIPEPLRGVAARGPRYKVIQLDRGGQGFFDLQADPLERTNLLGTPANPALLTVPQRTAYAGLTNRLAGWHNPPPAPTITRVEAGPDGVAVSAPEQLGAAYALERSPTLGPPAWTVVPGFEREVLLAEPLVRLRDPAPPDPAFYRVTAQGR